MKNLNQQKHALSAMMEIKTVAEDGTFSGYASVFDVVDSYRDIIRSGAFASTIADYASKGRMPSLLWQHNNDEPCGIIVALREDQRGLYFEGKLALDTQRGKEAHALLKMGALNGLSIGYSVVKYDYDEKQAVRLLLEVELWEVSLVTFPANDAARVTQVKKLDGVTVSNIAERKRDVEAALRDAGASDSVARFIASHIRPPAGCDAQGEAGDMVKSVERAFAILTS